MSFLEGITGAIGALINEVETKTLPSLFAQSMEAVHEGGLQGLLMKLQDSGLATQVTSWLGKGENLPISVDQLKAVLSEQHVQDLAASLGIQPNAVLGYLSEHLPTVVDKLSPNGALETTA